MLGVSADQAAALAVGRHRDGQPVMPATTPQPGADANDFNFTGDDRGAVCPFQAHIRKTNPRGDIPRFIQGGTEEFERSMRILRRGITFGERPDLQPGSTLPPPATGVGLLFMSYQQQLLQFVIQQEGSDGDDFVVPGVGPDATLGNRRPRLAQQWPIDGQPNAQGSGWRTSWPGASTSSARACRSSKRCEPAADGFDRIVRDTPSATTDLPV